MAPASHGPATAPPMTGAAHRARQHIAARVPARPLISFAAGASQIIPNFGLPLPGAMAMELAPLLVVLAIQEARDIDPVFLATLFTVGRG